MCPMDFSIIGRLFVLVLVAVVLSLVGAQLRDCSQHGMCLIIVDKFLIMINIDFFIVDFLHEFGVRTTTQPATSACDGYRASDMDVAYQISPTDYSTIDGDILLGDSFPVVWCLLASINCSPSEAGTLLYYKDYKGLGFRMSVLYGQLTFDMRNKTFSRPLQLCDNRWNQFSVCYDGETLTMSKDCTNIHILGQPSDPRFSTHTGELTLFINGSRTEEFSVRLIANNNICLSCSFTL